MVDPQSKSFDTTDSGNQVLTFRSTRRGTVVKNLGACEVAETQFNLLYCKLCVSIKKENCKS